MALAFTRSRERVARNFIKTYGHSGFLHLINDLSAGRSGQQIANHFGVSRERVRQWKNTFGQVIVLYQLHPEVERLYKQCSEHLSIGK